jgi:prolyl oligopeptidase
VVGENFFANYLKDAYSKVKVFDLTGKFQREVEFAGIGTAYGFYGKRGDSETFYGFTGYTNPTTIFHYDVASGKSMVYRKPAIDFDSNTYTTKQIFYKSKERPQTRRQQPDLSVRVWGVQHIDHASF